MFVRNWFVILISSERHHNYSFGSAISLLCYILHVPVITWSSVICNTITKNPFVSPARGNQSNPTPEHAYSSLSFKSHLNIKHDNYFLGSAVFSICYQQCQLRMTLISYLTILISFFPFQCGTDENAVLLLAGNKMDLSECDSHRVVKYKDGAKLAEVRQLLSIWFHTWPR